MSIAIPNLGVAGFDTDELLLAGTGSVVPFGAVTVAVLVRMQVASADMVPVTVKVADAPLGRSTSVETFPEPDAVHVAPPVGAQDQVAEMNPVGKVSSTDAPVTADGPRLLTTRA